ncbi:DUF805 domain-containing protein [Hymenobacter oligotrophus]|uniref:DUF805 domain-containing protein n=1 Tax=Hymenobacter oligotrophus TaxID=2319843 RepID=A0A3B7R2K7_9BACT|nr:DUF805 domain-containing protein [Hymenobacter oligotrophus]AYA37643.1 DUF805 domain-containing protein [Hymenobacter oligotrophus]
MRYFLRAFDKFGVFTGRARRKEYWMFIAYQALFGATAFLLDNILGITLDDESALGYTQLMYLLAVIMPNVSAGTRRLHDVNRSGLNLLAVFVPVVGWAWLLYLLSAEGTPGPNRYGLAYHKIFAY